MTTAKQQGDLVIRVKGKEVIGKILERLKSVDVDLFKESETGEDNEETFQHRDHYSLHFSDGDYKYRLSNVVGFYTEDRFCTLRVDSGKTNIIDIQEKKLGPISKFYFKILDAKDDRFYENERKAGEKEKSRIEGVKSKFLKKLLGEIK